MPEFGMNLNDLTRQQSPYAATQQLNYGDMMGAVEETSDSDEDLISAFKW